MSFTTNPNPLISNSPGTLTYIDYTYTPVHNNIYALRNSQNIQVPNSSTYTSSINNFNNNTFRPLLSSLTNDGNGNFYFGENETGKIYQYILSSNTITVIINIGAVSKISLTYYNGYLYIGNWSTNTVDKYDVSVNPPTKTTFASGTNINQPNGLVFNILGELYIANHGSGRIVKYVSSTNTYTILPTNPSTISQPYGLALDSNSNLYIASWDLYVYKYNVTTQTTSIYFQDTVDTRVQPYGLIFDSYDNLYITSFNWIRVYKVAPNQTFTIIMPFGSLGGRPTGMTIYNNILYFLTNNNGNSVPWRVNNYNLFLYFSNLILDTSQILTVYNNNSSQTIATLNVEVDEETEYISENINLFSIFAPIPEGYTGPYADETYIINKNKDLNQLFLPYTSGDPKAPLTNYHTLNFKDLNEVFKKL